MNLRKMNIIINGSTSFTGLHLILRLLKEDNNILKENNYNKKVLKIPDSEINLHKEFIKKQLKKNYY